MRPFRSRLVWLSALGLATVVYGCGGESLVLPNEAQPAKIEIVRGDAQAGPAGGALSDSLVVTVSDARGRPIENQPVEFTPDAPGDASPDTVRTLSDGTAASRWTLGPSAGAQHLQARVVGDNAPADLLVSFHATAVAGAGAAIELVSGDGQSGPVKSALADSLVVRVVDAVGNPVPGVQVDWTVSGGGSIDPASVLTGTDGRAAAARVLGSAAVPQAAEAAASGLDGSPVHFSHAAVAANPTELIRVSGDGQTAPAGFEVAEDLVVQLRDGDGNGVGGKVVTWALPSGSGLVNPFNSTTDPSGFARTRWTLGSQARNYTLNAVYSGLPSVPFTARATADVPTTIALDGGDNQTGVVLQDLADPLSVKVTDSNGNPVENVTVNWARQDGGSVSSPTSATDAAGIAQVTRTLGATPVSYGTTATVTGLSGSPVTFTSTATVGAPVKLAIAQAPSSTAQSGSPLAQQPVVQVQDVAGNPVNAANLPVMAAVSAGGTLTGVTTKLTDATGKATFTNLAISGTAGTAYQLTFTSGALQSVSSGDILLASGGANRLAFSVQPSSVTAGSSISPAVKVRIEDAQGNLVSGATNQITMAIGSNPGSGTLSGTKTVNAVAGIATFSDLSINRSGVGYTLSASAGGLGSTGSTSFTVSAGPAASLAFVQQPVNAVAGATITPAVKVAVQDALGNTVTSATTSITLTIGTNPGGGTLSGTTTVSAVAGVATFSTLSINKSGNGYTLHANGGGLSQATSAAFNITTGSGNKLVFTVQPSSTVVGEVITPAVTVEVQDAQGNRVTTATNAITISSSTAGTLSGDNSVNAIAGVATFSDLAITQAASDYTLSATASGLAGAASDPFDVAKASTTTAITADTPNPSVVGQTVTVSFSVAVGAPGSGTPTGTVTVGDGSVSCSAAVAAGSCQLVFTTIGSHSLTASYTGDANFSASGSSTAGHQVNAASTTTAVVSSDPQSDAGQSVTFTATVSVTAPGAGTPTGSVGFFDGATQIGSDALDGSGVAQLSTSSLSVGSHSITAQYLGSSSFSGSTSSAITQLVNAVNAAPTADDDSYNTDEDTPLSVSAGSGVLVGDSDPDGDPLTAVLVTGPADSATTSFTLNPDGSFSFQPAPNFNGSVSFTYQANDGSLKSNTATVTITVASVNDAPSFTVGPDQSVSASAGAQTVPNWATSISAGASNESGQALTFHITTGNDGAFDQVPSISPSGTLTYTPSPSAAGTNVTVTVSLSDDGGIGNGGLDTSGDQTFTIDITP